MYDNSPLALGSLFFSPFVASAHLFSTIFFFLSSARLHASCFQKSSAIRTPLHTQRTRSSKQIRHTTNAKHLHIRLLKSRYAENGLCVFAYPRMCATVCATFMASQKKIARREAPKVEKQCHLRSYTDTVSNVRALLFLRLLASSLRHCLARHRLSFSTIAITHTHTRIRKPIERCIGWQFDRRCRGGSERARVEASAYIQVFRKEKGVSSLSKRERSNC